jgi:DNA helicase-2/ATP-dependent DNA helicase PcrA
VQRAALFFKEHIQEGLPAEECALLVPKNAQVKAAVRILEDVGLEAHASGAVTLFATPEYQSLAIILRLMADPFDAAAAAAFILDPVARIPVLEAQKFLHKTHGRDLSVEVLAKEFAVGEKLQALVASAAGRSAYEAVQQAGEVFLLDSATTHEAMLRRVEVVRTLLHLALALENKHRGKVVTLSEFGPYLARLEEYGEDIPLATFDEGQGIRVMTLHRSKGLEFGAVWIAHLSERSLMKGSRMGLALPERLKVVEEKKDLAAARRELYVALTRAKRFAALSYPLTSYAGADEELAAALEEMPREHFDFEDREMSMKKVLSLGLAETVASRKPPAQKAGLLEVQKLVAEHFGTKKVSASALNSFFDCPWQWYFRYFLGLPEPKAEALIFGSVVHGAIEILLKDESQKLETVVEEALDHEHVFEARERRRMKTDALKILKKFTESLAPDLYEEKEVEKRLSAKDKRFPGLHFTGAIDLMEHAGGGAVRLTDFKTGRPRKASEIEKRDEEGRLSSYVRQLAMYSYLLELATKGQYEVEKSRLYFAESDDPALMLYETVIGSEEEDLLLADIKDYSEALEKGTWVERACKHKGHGGAACASCALKERLFE